MPDEQTGEEYPPTETEIVHELLKTFKHHSPTLSSMWDRLQRSLDSGPAPASEENEQS